MSVLRNHPWLGAIAIGATLLIWQTRSQQPSASASLSRTRAATTESVIARRMPLNDERCTRQYSGEQFADPTTALYVLCLGDPAANYEIEYAACRSRSDACAAELKSSSPRQPANQPSVPGELDLEDLPPAAPHVSLELSGPEVADRPPRTVRTFFFPPALPRADFATVGLLETELIAESREVRIYLERGVRLDRSFPEFIAAVDELSEQIVAASLPNWGRCRDVDGDGKLSIVLTSRLSQYEEHSAGRLDGCVRWEDFIDVAPRSFGNAADVIFLNPEIPDRNQLSAVLAHEYGHLLAFTRRGIGLAAEAVPDEDWLNEALAHVLEIRLSGRHSNLADRIEAFLSHPERTALVVTDSSRARLWRDPGNRGAGYLFLDWLIQTSPTNRLDRLMRGPERGMQLVEAAAGRAFPAVWSAWAADLWTHGVPPWDETGGRRFPAAVVLNPASTPQRIAVRGMSVCYFRLPERQPEGVTVRVLLPTSAAWQEGWAHRRNVRDGRPPPSAPSLRLQASAP